MMQQEWKEECAAYAREQGLVAEANGGEAAPPRYTCWCHARSVHTAST